jgi:hypothetical protein
MPFARHLLSAAALCLMSVSATAATTVYTTSASFLAQVAPGAYTETFTALSNPPPGPATFSSGGFAYTAFAPGDLYLAGGFLGTSQISEALKITFTSGNVTAVGANFYSTNISDAFQAVSVTLTLNDGTLQTFTPTSVATSFRGFVSTVPITMLTMSAPGAALYAGMDNVTVGRAALVPEPASWLLLGLGLGGVGLLAARRRSA